MFPSAGRTLRITALALSVASLLFLPFAGRFLDHDDPLERADVMFVLAGGGIERWLEAVDLYNEGWAPGIVLSPGSVGSLEAVLQARGIRFPREGDLTREAIISSGVPPEAVTILPGSVDNTAHEASALRQTLQRPDPRRILVVTSTYHTRRTGLAFRRAFAGSGVDVRIRGSRYSDATPGRWWRRRPEIRFVTSELQKYVLYAVGIGD